MSRRQLRLDPSSDDDEYQNPKPYHTLILSDDDEEFVGNDDAVFHTTAPSIERSAHRSPTENGAETTTEMPEPRAEGEPRSQTPSMGNPSHGDPGVVSNPRVTGSGGLVSAIDELLRVRGIRVRVEWLNFCVNGLTSLCAGFESLDVTGKAKKCFEQFLVSDMNISGAGVLPENVCGMHDIELAGPFVLQVDEVVNICAPLRERYHEAAATLKRCLKLSMTDGCQRVFGMEYRPIKELQVLSAGGLKVVIHHVNIRRGLLMLVPETVEILGGLVDDLDIARKRLVDEVNKPPRSKRKHGMLPLSQRASLAAWSSSMSTSGTHTISSVINSANNQEQLAEASTLNSNRNVTGGAIADEPVDHHPGRNYTEVANWQVRPGTTSVAMDNIIDEDSSDNTIQEQANNIVPDDQTNSAFDHTSDIEMPHASDVNDAFAEVDHPLILRGNNEIPFTYLGSLFAKWVIQKDNKLFIRGKIKCFLTGVKGFQFKERSTYELYVYVDDGSLISEVLVDHSVVMKCIGHSPEEVTAALSSSDKNTQFETRDTMKKFQLFLSKFEGIVLLEMNRNFSVPIVLEMDQGCSTTDACLLLSRLKKLIAPQDLLNDNMNPIDISH